MGGTTSPRTAEAVAGIQAQLAGRRVAWKANPGSQILTLSCPHWEVLVEGERGSGKTQACIVRFLMHVGQGWGGDWRGIYLRRTYRELREAIVKSRDLIQSVQGFEGATFNKAPGGAEGYTWNFPDGEWLMFAAAKSAEDVTAFLGWELPYVCYEELTAWPTPDVYDALKGCSRSPNPEVARHKVYLSNTNAWGPGAGWVKDRFVSPAPACEPIPTLEYDDPHTGRREQLYRVRIPGFLHENLALANDPAYRAQLESISDENKRRAWIGGDKRWDIVVGGIIGDVWSEAEHVVRPFNVPHSWTVNRAYDHGATKPFDVGWWAESDGTGVVQLASSNGGGIWYEGTLPRGSLVLVNEWYGWNGKANQGVRMRPVEIADGIKEFELQMRRGYLRAFERIDRGPADTEIFAKRPGEQSVAERMSNAGVQWTEANKAAGSRKQGAEMMRDMLQAVVEQDMESPWLLIFDVPGTREGFIRTVPALPRSEKDPDDAETEGVEDHPYDMARYRILPKRGKIEMGGRVAG